MTTHRFRSHQQLALLEFLDVFFVTEQLPLNIEINVQEGLDQLARIVCCEDLCEWCVVSHELLVHLREIIFLVLILIVKWCVTTVIDTNIICEAVCNR